METQPNNPEENNEPENNIQEKPKKSVLKKIGTFFKDNAPIIGGMILTGVAAIGVKAFLNKKSQDENNSFDDSIENSMDDGLANTFNDVNDHDEDIWNDSEEDYDENDLAYSDDDDDEENLTDEEKYYKHLREDEEEEERERLALEEEAEENPYSYGFNNGWEDHRQGKAPPNSDPFDYNDN